MFNAHQQQEGAGDTSIKTILVVEDDGDIGSFLVQAISQETTHHALLVTDGFQALKTVHELQPNLLIIDYQLPHMNGIALYDQLTTRTGLESIPTIMMTARLPAQEIAIRTISAMKTQF